MSVLEWKSVELFDLIAENSSRFPTINADITAHCYAVSKSINGSTSSTSVLCDTNGSVHVIFENENLMPISFKCHYGSNNAVKLCALTTNQLLTLVTQEDSNTNSFCVQVYDLKNFTKKDKIPNCISTTIITSTSAATFLQAAVLGTDSPNPIFAIGIGFDKGDLQLNFSKISRGGLLLNFRRYSIGVSSINGIIFERSAKQSDTITYNVFVTCLDSIYCLALNDKGFEESKIILDTKRNIYNHCCTISQPIGSESFLVAGRDDAIFCFTRDGDGRGPCYAIGGEKQFISWKGHHLVVVVKTPFDSVVICVDVENKLIVFHKRINNFVCVVSGGTENNPYYIFTKSEKLNLFRLQEHNTANKVQLLLSKCMYDNTLRILERSLYTDSQNATYVRLQYGNNLLMKGSLSRAVQQFKHTIGVIKPYEIISKLLYSRHNNNLKQYLCKLRKSNHNYSVEQNKLHERCCHREMLSLRTQQFWDCRSHFCDFQQLLDRADTVLGLISVRNQSESMISIFQNTEEKEILNFFQEYGREFLAINSNMLLETMKTLVQERKIHNILPFLIIFSDHHKFCENLLVDLSNELLNSAVGLHYYKLLIYLCLWREKKKSYQVIQKYLKETPLTLNNIIILCKVYFFSIESVNLHNDNADQETLICPGKNLAKIKSVASLLTFPSTQVLYLKTFMVKKLIENMEEAKNDHELIENLRDEIQANNSQLFQFTYHPIEFRNSCCDICRQSLHMPSVYFLCQHSFHIDCIRYNYNTKINNNEIFCFICNNNNKYNSVIDCEKIDISIKSNDIIEEVSTVFATGIDNLRGNKNKKNNYFDPFASNIEENSKNPFNVNYDSNFNCF